MLFGLLSSVLTISDIANWLLKIKALQKHIKTRIQQLITWQFNLPYLSLDTKTGAVLVYRYMGEFLLFSYPYMEL